MDVAGRTGHMTRYPSSRTMRTSNPSAMSRASVRGLIVALVWLPIRSPKTSRVLLAVMPESRDNSLSLRAHRRAASTWRAARPGSNICPIRRCGEPWIRTAIRRTRRRAGGRTSS